KRGLRVKSRMSSSNSMAVRLSPIARYSLSEGYLSLQNDDYSDYVRRIWPSQVRERCCARRKAHVPEDSTKINGGIFLKCPRRLATGRAFQQLANGITTAETVNAVVFLDCEFPAPKLFCDFGDTNLGLRFREHAFADEERVQGEGNPCFCEHWR